MHYISSMKKLIYISVILLLCKITYSQTNLVPNGSFEDYNQCPTFESQSFLLQNWINFGGTPDYFNTCSSATTGVSIPENFGGFQEPFSGNGYITLSCWNNSLPSNIRECIGVKLTDTLVVGTKYFMSLHVSPCFQNPDQGGLGFTMINNFGFYFTKQPLDSMNLFANNKSQVYDTNVVSDTISWTTIKGSFVADSSYTYLAIGNFMADSLTTIDTTYISGYNMLSKEAYYYFDNVCVTDDSLFNEQNSIGIKKHQSTQSIKTFPNPVKDDFSIDISEIVYIEIIDLQGNIITSQINQNNNIFNAKELTNGLYFIKIFTKTNEQYTTKLLKSTL